MSNLPVPERRGELTPVDLDALPATQTGEVVTRMWMVDPDELMAALGRRVQGQYRGAATTAAGVRAIRESWKRPSLWDRLVVWVTVR